MTRREIRGDLHVHMRETDGTASLEEMAGAAQARGYAYLAITDHSRRVTMAHGLDARRLAAQMKRIDRLNDRRHGPTLLKGCEVDILAVGGGRRWAEHAHRPGAAQAAAQGVPRRT